jgi:hypothetical protein
MGPEIGTCIGIDASVVWMSSSPLCGKFGVFWDWQGIIDDLFQISPGLPSQ